MSLTHRFSRSLTLLGLVCAVSGAFFVGRTLGASSQAANLSRMRSHIPIPSPSQTASSGNENPLVITPVSGNVASSDSGNANTTPSNSNAQDPPSSVSPTDVYEEALTNVRRNFVEIDAFPLSKLDTDGIGRMYATLGDPRTYALTVERCRARYAALDGRFGGIGAVLAITRTRKVDVDYSHLTVMDVMPDSPAEKAGLRTGDHITEIDGRWVINYTIYADADRIGRDKSLDTNARQQQIDQVNHKFKAGLSLSRALDMLNEGQGKPLTLTLERPAPGSQAKPAPNLTVTLTTNVCDVSPVTFRLIEAKGKRESRLGYLRVRQFNARATADFTRAILKMEDLEPGSLAGMILDLRQNPGGVTTDTESPVDGYSSARRLLALLTNGGTMARIERRPGHREPLAVSVNSHALHTKMVVLVDGGTANIAELVASALHDTARARLIGAHTFGDNVLSMFARFKSGVGVEMTTAHLFTANGTDIARGLEPDILYGDAGNDEAILSRARTTLEL